VEGEGKLHFHDVFFFLYPFPIAKIKTRSECSNEAGLRVSLIDLAGEQIAAFAIDFRPTVSGCRLRTWRKTKRHTRKSPVENAYENYDIRLNCSHVPKKWEGLFFLFSKHEIFYANVCHIFVLDKGSLITPFPKFTNLVVSKMGSIDFEIICCTCLYSY